MIDPHKILVRSSKTLFFCLLLFLKINGTLIANEILINRKPIKVITNPCIGRSLINSVEFHPTKNLFFVTFTQGNKVVLYKKTIGSRITTIQTLKNPLSQLNDPQHAAFSPDDKTLVVANWSSRVLTVYQREQGNHFNPVPAAIIPHPPSLSKCRPHGITFSPEGDILAIAFGATSNCDRAVALFRVTKNGLGYELADMLGSKQLPGIPKGITFTPDGSCMLVTFCDTNKLVIFEVDRINKTILPTPRQVIEGTQTGISRPEDVKISKDKHYCAITNSDRHTVTFYPFDATLNLVTDSTPHFVLENPESNLCFPHGIAFSPDGSLLLVTLFGPMHLMKDEDITWDTKALPKDSKVNIYEIVNTH